MLNIVTLQIRFVGALVALLSVLYVSHARAIEAAQILFSDATSDLTNGQMEGFIKWERIVRIVFFSLTPLWLATVLSMDFENHRGLAIILGILDATVGGALLRGCAAYKYVPGGVRICDGYPEEIRIVPRDESFFWVRGDADRSLLVKFFGYTDRTCTRVEFDHHKAPAVAFIFLVSAAVGFCALVFSLPPVTYIWRSWGKYYTHHGYDTLETYLERLEWEAVCEAFEAFEDNPKTQTQHRSREEPLGLRRILSVYPVMRQISESVHQVDILNLMVTSKSVRESVSTGVGSNAASLERPA
ncbi:hypothetical protein FQN54_008898 [Arachnomyces sp. PD_36]|nr:hypothetical protein FQN54_008898 [Arachnomyces sp. PD_36]